MYKHTCEVVLSLLRLFNLCLQVFSKQTASSLDSDFGLDVGKFVGDRSSVLHIGPSQYAVVQRPEDIEFVVNVYVYEGGTLILPPTFSCLGTAFHIM